MSGLSDWFQTPPGQYVLDWERARFDAALADVFGYHALQLGLPAIDALAANRMAHRWLALTVPPSIPNPAGTSPPASGRTALIVDSTALPFAEGSLDLVVLPHTLELSADPHATLREVQRVLVHEGRVAITGLNPTSLWGLRLRRVQPSLPDAGEFIGHWRLRDWLRLLEFELESLSFGCYRPAVRSERALARYRWLDRIGARCWPIFGAAYFILAVKRTRGARLVGPAWKNAPAVAGTPASVANRTAPAPHEKAHEPG
ncbi:MAG: class I SAM-dependent methyltransferase [Burkholderiaceae bacterium]|jgi:SAM-dependent methyltransferase|nr:class I SAM-dependent methyltransferase [Burkholderiaceae bacterium]